jgi:ABC-type multidrug transport system ATPase subunit
MSLVAQPVIIDAKGLRRLYGRRKKTIEAVRNVSFEVRRGEIFGLIGPDGAGKTSIIQILAGVLRANGGSASVSGIDVIANPEAVKVQVGYMPQGLGVNLYESLTVAENIEFFRDLRKLPEQAYQKNRDELLHMTRLTRFVDRRAGNLSGGMRQKLALICTLIHLPEVILLDEPTTGVDPISRLEFWQIIRQLIDERQVTVLLSTSYMDEAERCHRIALMHSGSFIEQGDPDELKAKARGQYAKLIAEPQADALRLLRDRRDVLSTEVFGKEIRIRCEGRLGEIERGLHDHGIQILQIAGREPDLEDLCLELLPSAKQQNPELPVAGSRRVEQAMTIECEAVTRRFGEFVAVDNVDLRVRRGEIFGLLGPNGAGKTTLIKMMCGLLDPSGGSIQVAGFDIKSDKRRVWTQIGYMSQHFSFYRDLTVRQNLRLYADLYDVRDAHVEHMSRSLGLKEWESRLAGGLPTGLRQRLSLLCAVLHGPPVLFLDEPTSGVDPVARKAFWDLIYSLSRESEVTILISTHYMDEADHCDRLGLMDQGRLIAVDSPAVLKQISEERSGKLLAVHAPSFQEAFDVIVRAFPEATLFGDRIHVRSEDLQLDRPKLASLMRHAGIQDAVISERPLSMDETFIDFIRRAEMVHA